MLIKVFTCPSALFQSLRADTPALQRMVLGYVIWMALLPPVCAYIGITSFGWELGVGEPIRTSHTTTLVIAILYYFTLLIAYLVTTYLIHWIAPTYGASEAYGLHGALVAIIGTPLMVGGVMHLYPFLPLNLLCLIPAILWSCYLLYTGIPVLFQIDASRGMLMASSVLGIFFVSAIAVASFTMMVWTLGLGPDIGFDWRFSVAG